MIRKGLQSINKTDRRLRVLTAAALFLGMLASGCARPPSDEQIKQQAADATRQVKQDAQQAAATARVAAANAEDKINAVAAGVKQGLQSGQSAPTLDLNAASRDQLVTLPGITAARARRIIEGRPYATANDLVAKGILSQSQYDRIANRVRTK